MNVPGNVPIKWNSPYEYTWNFNSNNGNGMMKIKSKLEQWIYIYKAYNSHNCQFKTNSTIFSKQFYICSHIKTQIYKIKTLVPFKFAYVPQQNVIINMKKTQTNQSWPNISSLGFFLYISYEFCIQSLVIKNKNSYSINIPIHANITAFLSRTLLWISFYISF